MRTVQTFEAKAKFSALIAAVETGEEIAITRHGKIVACIVPEAPRMVTDIFRPLWQKTDIDLMAPEDTPPPQPVPALD